MVLPVLNFGSHNSIAGSLGDTTSLSHAIAMVKHYGPSSIMLTGTPDDVNNPTSYCLASRSIDNTKFPSVADEDFFSKLHEGGEYLGDGSVAVPLGYTERVHAAVGNPVAVACEFRAMVENILQILIGCPLDFQPGTNSKQVRTWYFKANAKNCPHHKGILDM